MSEQVTLDATRQSPDPLARQPPDDALHRASETVGLDTRLAVRAAGALALANLRYWTSVAPIVRRELGRWRRRAAAIKNQSLRELALSKLVEEGFNAEVAATLATLVARPRRQATIEAIVALEVLFDYLDGLTETLHSSGARDGERLSSALTDAVSPAATASADYYAFHAHGNDGGYLAELVATVRERIAAFPASAQVADLLLAAAQRSAEAQLQIHNLTASGHAELERWGRAQALAAPQQWRELLAGAASSVLCVHALIALAADPQSTHEQGRQTDRTYLWISALPTILDSLIDNSRDHKSGQVGYLALYESTEALIAGLGQITRAAIAHARAAPHTAHHVMTLVGVLAYYGSAPSAAHQPARGAIAPTIRQLRPLIGPTLAVMRTWRLAKRVAKRRAQAPTASRGRTS